MTLRGLEVKKSSLIEKLILLSYVSAIPQARTQPQILSVRALLDVTLKTLPVEAVYGNLNKLVRGRVRVSLV